MSHVTRRTVLASLAATGAAAALLRSTPAMAECVVIVGGGPAGTTAALALRTAQPQTRVTVIEADTARFGPSRATPFAPPESGVDAGLLASAGIEVLNDEVTGIDWSNGRIHLFSGRTQAFDHLGMAAGIASLPETIDGLTPMARHIWPAAWGSQREAHRLSAALSALPEAGHVVMRLPEMGLSHPEVALTRAQTLASVLMQTRPRARLTILDGQTDRTLQQSFSASGGAVNTRWLGPDQGGRVLSLDAGRGLIETDAGPITADVVNFIPPQGAGVIARASGLTGADHWCPCDATGASLLQASATILGDARAGAMRTLPSAVSTAMTFAG
jgi:sarcosine oxidase gamma subunit